MSQPTLKQATDTMIENMVKIDGVLYCRHEDVVEYSKAIVREFGGPFKVLA